MMEEGAPDLLVKLMSIGMPKASEAAAACLRNLAYNNPTAKDAIMRVRNVFVLIFY